MESIYSIPDLIMTQDGSYTLYSKDHGVTYHSRYGAIQESNHVFVDSGLLPVLKKKEKFSILEIGFGTGLNVLLTWKNIVDKNTVHVDYHSFDVYPLPDDLLNACVYEDHLKIPATISKNILSSEWDNLIFRSRAVASRTRKTSSSNGFTGVYKEHNKFRSVISLSGKSKHLGMFKTAEEAAKAFNEMSKKLYGDEGKQNILD